MHSDLIEDAELEVVPYEEVDDGKARFAHIVNPPNNLHIYQIGMTSQEIVDIARMTQSEIRALCGMKFVPKLNPDKYPACSKCMDIAANMITEKEG